MIQHRKGHLVLKVYKRRYSRHIWCVELVCNENRALKTFDKHKDSALNRKEAVELFIKEKEEL